MNVLVSAYACEPGKGSEPGAGWHWAKAAARSHEVCVITRANNRDRIEAELARAPEPSLRFVYVDLPRWAGFWKRGQRGIRAYYALWQLLCRREARRLHRERPFDLVHHVTFATIWLPALSALPGVPFVLGPVAGGQHVPLRLYPALGPTALVEFGLLALRVVMRLNPLVRFGWYRADLILLNNEETGRALPRRARRNVLVAPNACTSLSASRTAPATGEGPVAVCAGRLNRFKGVSIAVQALAHAPGWRLVIIGRGRDRNRLARIVEKCGLADRVELVPWTTQEELWRRIESAQALLLPSFKEGSTTVGAEAQMLGVPVVAFARGGPATLAESPGTAFELVPVAGPREAARLFGAALRKLEGGRPEITVNFGPDRLAARVEAYYARALAAPRGRAAVVAE